MQVVEKIKDVKTLLLGYRKEGKKIGFVPTMGALHKGHVSLIAKAKDQNDIVVCSIFVNPTQFNDKKDLERYPRPIEEDKKILVLAGCDVLFLPSVDEMYPVPDKRVFDFDELDKVMEGAHRPGHFNGVAQIVSKLFDVVMPDKAYFGQKDFQQQTIIKALVKQLKLPIQIVTCPIVREENGLAMSSRNKLLSDNERKEAAIIYQTLLKVKELSKKHTVQELKQVVSIDFSNNNSMKLEYFEIVAIQTLKSITDFSDHSEAIACIAVKLGGIRLIDNILL